MRIDAPVMPRNSHDPEEPVEQLLRSFFRAELPEPWPAFKPLLSPSGRGVGVRGPAVSRGSWFGSRVALAATVAFCLVGSLFVMSHFDAGNAPTSSGLSGPTIADPAFIGGRPVQPVIVTTPDNHRAKVLERRVGKETFIRVELLPDLPMMD